MEVVGQTRKGNSLTRYFRGKCQKRDEVSLEMPVPEGGSGRQLKSLDTHVLEIWCRL